MKQNQLTILILSISFVIAVSTIFLPYDTITNKNIHDSIVLTGLNNQDVGNFYLSTDAQVGIIIDHSIHSRFTGISLNMQQHKGHLFVSDDTKLPFWNCWYKNIPCYFVADFINMSKMKSLIQSITPTKPLPYCDKNHNCSDDPNTVFIQNDDKTLQLYNGTIPIPKNHKSGAIGMDIL